MTLAEDIEAQLTDHGAAFAELDTEAWAMAWRKEARSVARRLGRPVQTVSYPRRGRIAAEASLRDFPRDDAEQERRDDYLHAKMREFWKSQETSPSILPTGPGA